MLASAHQTLRLGPKRRLPVPLLQVFVYHVTLTLAGACLWCLFVWRQGLDMPEGAIRSRASEPLERQVELLKTTAFVATALVPFAAKVSVVPCCSVRFGTAEREQAELAR